MSMQVDIVRETSGIKVVLNGVSKTLDELYQVAEDPIKTMETHSATQAFWGVVAADALAEQGIFDELDFDKYMSHIKQFAKYILKWTGQKDTIEATKDLAMQVFSSDISDEQRAAYAKDAYCGYLTQYESSSTIKDRVVAWSDEMQAAYSGFYLRMYTYIQAKVPWFYEDVIRMKNQVKAKTECLRVIADSFKQRGFMLTAIAEAKREQMINDGSLVIGDNKKFENLVDEVAKRLAGQLRKGGGSGAEDVTEGMMHGLTRRGLRD